MLCVEHIILKTRRVPVAHVVSVRPFAHSMLHNPSIGKLRSIHTMLDAPRPTDGSEQECPTYSNQQDMLLRADGQAKGAESPSHATVGRSITAANQQVRVDRRALFGRISCALGPDVEHPGPLGAGKLAGAVNRALAVPAS